jgi:hypothetical protein
LAKALAEVTDSPEARTYLAWTDLSAVRQLAHLPASASQLAKAKPNQRWAGLFGIANDLAAFEPAITAKTKIDLLAADTTMQIGQPPNNADRLDGPGVNTEAISRALIALGAKREATRGRTFLAFGAEHSLSLTGPLANLGTSTLDRSVANGHTFATGSAVAPVEAILGGGRPLGQNRADAAAAGCLGDVLAAVILAANQLSPLSPGLVAIGDRRPATASSPVTEVLCTVGSTKSTAAAETSRLRTSLGPSGRLPSKQGLGKALPANQVVSSATVGRADRNGLQIVRAVMTLRPVERAGYLYDLLQSGQLGAVL